MYLLKFIVFFFLLSHSTFSAGVTTVEDMAPKIDSSKDGKERIELGRALFFDKNLSANKTVSCASCHNINNANGGLASGGDGLNVSLGVHGIPGTRNAPSVWNAALRSGLFWDGRAPSLEEQAKGPLVNPVEMKMADLDAVVSEVDKNPGYREKFKRLYGNNSPKYKINIEDIAAAIARYEETLITINSRFDQYQKGNENAINAQEKNGWKRFQEIGCVACHGAPTFSKQDYFVKFPLRSVREDDFLLSLRKDLGRYNSTKNFGDINRWRVPSLRNVEITGPYFHNGSVKKLEDAVRLMGRAQIGVDLSEADVKDIVAFLKTLTGEQPKTASVLKKK